MTAEIKYDIEMIDVDELKPHPDNYRHHGAEQINHIIASLQANGFYRNLVIAEDNTILAGHGVLIASKQIGHKKVPCRRIPIAPNSSQALRIVVGDNEIAKLGEVDDRKLTEILRQIDKEIEDGLAGTGFDKMQLANLVMVTRHADEIADFEAAKEWVGLPSYETKDETRREELLIEISFQSAADRDRFIKESGLKIATRMGERKWSTMWPFRERHDVGAVKFEGVEPVAAAQ